jgi:GAF domain-containing protein
VTTTTTSAATATVAGRLFHTRGVVIYLIIAIASVPASIYTFAEAIARVRAPDVGLLHDWDLSVTAVDERWPGVERGDRIVALDGVPVVDARDWMARVLAGEPGPVRITFARDGTTWEQWATSTPMSGAATAAIFGRVIVGMLIILVGLITFLLQPGRPTTWLLLLFGTFLGAQHFVMTALQRDIFAFHLCTTPLLTLSASTGVHLFTILPRPLFKRGPSPIWLYVPPAILIPATLGSAAAGATTAWRAFYFAGFVWAALSALASLPVSLLQLRQAKRAHDLEARAQSRALILAFVFGFTGPALWALFRRGFGVADTLWAGHWNGLPTIFFVAITAYVALRHNSFAIDRFSATLVGYAATTILLVGTLAGCVIGLPLLVGPSSSPAVLVALTAIVFALGLRVHRWIKRRVDRWFFRDSNTGTMAEALRKLSETISESPRAVGHHVALDAAMNLHVDRAELWVLDSVGASLERLARAGTPPPEKAPSMLPRHGPLGEAIQGGGAGGVHSLAQQELDPMAQGDLWSLGLAAVVPIRAHGVTAGFLAVGRKRSGGRFEPDDMSYLGAIAAQLGLSLERSTDDGAQLGRYRIERRLGVGGMAEVFLAWQLGPGGFERKVALKRPLPSLEDDADCIKMFLDEARIAAQLHHRNIVQIYEVDSHDGRYYIAMEFVDGPSLRTLIAALNERGQRAPLDISAGIVVAVLAALEHGYSQPDARGRPLQLVHRDVTPSNVLVSRQGDIKLVDFGIARVASRLATQTAGVKGTRPYMSPEQASGRVVDRRADLYSIGVLFYELVTGKKAFPDGRGTQDAEPPSQITSGLPRALDRVIARAMAYDRDQRYDTAAELRAAIVDAIVPAKPADPDDIARWLDKTDLAPAKPTEPLTETGRTTPEVPLLKR